MVVKQLKETREENPNRKTIVFSQVRIVKALTACPDSCRCVLQFVQFLSIIEDVLAGEHSLRPCFRGTHAFVFDCAATTDFKEHYLRYDGSLSASERESVLVTTEPWFRLGAHAGCVSTAPPDAVPFHAALHGFADVDDVRLARPQPHVRVARRPHGSVVVSLLPFL